jgi:hypothetical protein
MSKKINSKYQVIGSAVQNPTNGDFWNIAVFETGGDACEYGRFLLSVRPSWSEVRVIRVQGKTETTHAVYHREEATVTG